MGRRSRYRDSDDDTEEERYQDSDSYEDSNDDDDDDDDYKDYESSSAKKKKRKRIMRIAAGVVFIAVVVGLFVLIGNRVNSTSANTDYGANSPSPLPAAGDTSPTSAANESSSGSSPTATTSSSGSSSGSSSSSGSVSGLGSSGSSSSSKSSSSQGSSSSGPTSSKLGGGSPSSESKNPEPTTTSSDGDTQKNNENNKDNNEQDGKGGGGNGPYKISKTCEGDKFFDCFEFITIPDPTKGQVDYVDKPEAESLKLISVTDGVVRLGADSASDLAAGAERKSVRVSSKDTVSINSLIIADIRRMPAGCATWPAYWTFGADWPNGGEIDILEGVHTMPKNHITLHVSSSDCKIDPGADVLGSYIETNNDCNANVNGNAGCSWGDPNENSYGAAFNDNKGGISVTAFLDEGISVWFWPRGKEPEGLENPDPSKWGKPTAFWSSSTCSMDFFKPQNIIINTTLCGEWAGAVWDTFADCKALAATCSDYVMKGSNFAEAYWEFSYIKVYSKT